jgi:hypothetical protein
MLFTIQTGIADPDSFNLLGPDRKLGFAKSGSELEGRLQEVGYILYGTCYGDNSVPGPRGVHTLLGYLDCGPCKRQFDRWRS